MLRNTDRLVTKAAADYTIKVGATDAEYASIQEAINNSVDKDVIFVQPGTYNENLVVDKSLTIYAEDPSNTIINGDGITPAVHITAAAGSFKQFGVTASTNNQTGIFLDNSSSIDPFVIEGCSCYGNKNGIELNNSSGNTIYRNILTNNRQFGILLRDGSNGNQVEGNIATGNADGICFNNANNNTGEENEVTGNINTGFSYIYATGNVVFESTLRSNNIGMYFQNADSNTFQFNEIIDNLDAIKMVASSTNVVESNVLLERTVGSSVSLDADCSDNRINHNTYRIPAIDLGTNNVFVNNHCLAPALPYDVATVQYVDSRIQPGGESSDVVCGMLRAVSGSTLKWKFYSANHIRLYNTNALDWEIIDVGTEPTAASTEQDMCGSVLVSDLVYDVFAVYNSTSTSFDIAFAPWKVVSTDGANNPGTITCTTVMTSNVTPVPEVVSASSELYEAWNAFSDNDVRYWSSTPTPLATSA
jgi:parallel beta-helix repeat protein